MLYHGPKANSFEARYSSRRWGKQNWCKGVKHWRSAVFGSEFERSERIAWDSFDLITKFSSISAYCCGRLSLNDTSIDKRFAPDIVVNTLDLTHVIFQEHSFSIHFFLGRRWSNARLQCFYSWRGPCPLRVTGTDLRKCQRHHCVSNGFLKAWEQEKTRVIIVGVKRKQWMKETLQNNWTVTSYYSQDY